jgi:hypothetical protein
MAQRAHSACLLLEPKKTVHVGGERLRKDFYRHFPSEPCIARAIHFTHASGTQRADDLIGAQPSSGRKRHALLLTRRGVHCRVEPPALKE